MGKGSVLSDFEIASMENMECSGGMEAKTTIHLSMPEIRTGPLKSCHFGNSSSNCEDSEYVLMLFFFTLVYGRRILNDSKVEVTSWSNHLMINSGLMLLFVTTIYGRLYGFSILKDSKVSQRQVIIQ